MTIQNPSVDGKAIFIFGIGMPPLLNIPLQNQCFDFPERSPCTKCRARAPTTTIGPPFSKKGRTASPAFSHTHTQLHLKTSAQNHHQNTPNRLRVLSPLLGTRQNCPDAAGKILWFDLSGLSPQKFGHRFCPRADLQFFIDTADVGMDGFVADAEFIRYFLVN
jgi:hypothetical protein